ncbi:Glutamine--fructose-6-phosphate transaminase (isomerizing) [Coriobacterium glomerans PW2]|uniref:Glutamine--fructose-6-phosphate transaminase (Isomerizing) n=2 Tax=Coriobacterium TaxID=33870 RepID=F2NB60_CORGP|nr:Glutamine--fructose-6-phosphate transaminase (isomerizing) [Coriobacterium glomerans PW2]
MTTGQIKQTVLGNIRSQPEVLSGVFADQTSFTHPFSAEINEGNIRKIIFFGSGTSYNAAHIAAYYFKHIVGIAAEACYPTVFEHYEKPDWTGSIANDHILFVGISQSGTSVSTCRVMQYGRKLGCRTLAITNDMKSAITNCAETTIPLLVGDELTPPETKGYTVTILTAYLCAIETAKANGTLKPHEYDGMVQQAQLLISDFSRIIDAGENWYDRNKASIVNSDRIYVLGYGIDYGSMLEGMLKIGEMLRIPTIGYELEEFAHGPVMALRDNQTIVMIGSDEPEFERMIHFRSVFKQYTPRVHVLTCKNIEADNRDLIFSPATSTYLGPLVYTVPFQFVAAGGARDIFIDTNINPFKESLGHYEKMSQKKRGHLD